MTREEAHRILDAVLDVNDMYGRYKIMLEFSQYDFCDEQYMTLFVFDTIDDESKVVELCTVQEGVNTADDALTMIDKWNALTMIEKRRAENDAV